jgi:hypothetical protein
MNQYNAQVQVFRSQGSSRSSVQYYNPQGEEKQAYHPNSISSRKKNMTPDSSSHLQYLPDGAFLTNSSTLFINFYARTERGVPTVLVNSDQCTALSKRTSCLSSTENKVRKIITRVYALRTGKPFWVVSEDMERDVFMSADEAKAKSES